MTGTRQRRAYMAALRSIVSLKAKLETAFLANDEDAAALAHSELVDLEHEARLIEDVARATRKATDG